MITASEALERSMTINPAHREAVEAGSRVRNSVFGHSNEILDSMKQRVELINLAGRYSRTRRVDNGLPESATSTIEQSSIFNPQFVGITEEQAKKEILRLRIQAGRSLVSELAGYLESLELEIRAAGAD